MRTFLRLLTYVRRTIVRARVRASLTVLGTAMFSLGTALLVSRVGGTTMTAVQDFFASSGWIGQEPILVIGLAYKPDVAGADVREGDDE